jgi:hypothetical protein
MARPEKGSELPLDGVAAEGAAAADSARASAAMELENETGASVSA